MRQHCVVTECVTIKCSLFISNGRNSIFLKAILQVREDWRPTVLYHCCHKDNRLETQNKIWQKLKSEIVLNTKTESKNVVDTKRPIVSNQLVKQQY